jgi:four helix bundle protein
MTQPLCHERLDAYKLAVQVARWFRKTTFPTGDAALRDQARRAADSVVLNLAEGAHSLGGNRNKHFRIARGSAAEAAATLDLVPLEGREQKQDELRRIVAMLTRLR